MTCDHGMEHVQQLAIPAPERTADDLTWRASALAWWIGAIEYEGLDAELLEYGHHSHDDADRTHCGTAEIHGVYWDVYVVHTGETTSTRTRWDTLVDADGRPRYLPQGPETIELTAPYVAAEPQQHEPLGEDIRLAVAAAAEPRLLTPADGYLVERCVRAALAAADARGHDDFR